ncbi:MAG TPA: tRNA pseudouridine(55) synthase TruB, partial [Pyrinomonadaceae bacterium]|nr:tRNA pseudouridine(55) synthase TruB [Pyrinomonadaceae bacterium]
PTLHLTEQDARRVRHGAAVQVEAGEARWADGARVKFCDDAGLLLAVGVYDAGRMQLRPRVLLVAENKG